MLDDAQNYDFTSEITAGFDVVASGEDSVVDWSGLTEDLLGNPMDPAADCDVISIVAFEGLTQEEALQGINDDTLLQSDLSGFADYTRVADETSAKLSEFSLMGYPVDPAAQIVESESAYLVSCVTIDEATGNQSYRMFDFFRPVIGASSAPITLTSDSAELSYTVDLEAGVPVPLLADGRVRVDWSALTTGPSGLPIDLPDIDTLMIARYDEPIYLLEEDFLHVDSLAEQIWTADVEGWGDWYLDELEDADGEAFPGFTAESGTWLTALRCSTCLNPAPPFLGVVEP